MRPSNQGRSYVEAEEAVASPVFAGLMNNYDLIATYSTSARRVRVGGPFRLSFPKNRSIVRRVHIAVCTSDCTRPCHAGKASQNAPESISERIKFKNFLGGHAPRPPSRCVTQLEVYAHARACYHAESASPKTQS